MNFRILNFVPLLGALLSDPLSVTLVKKDDGDLTCILMLCA